MKASCLAWPLLLFVAIGVQARSQETGDSEVSRGLRALGDLGGTYQRGITSISLSGRSEFTGQQLASLASLSDDLRSLDLSGTAITDRGLQDIRLFPHLEHLDLRGTDISDNAFAHLAALKDLRSLSVAKTPITGSALVDLVELRRLTSLDLSETKLGRQGVSSLKLFPSLKSVSLAGTDITNADLAQLPGAVNLETLILDRTQLTDEGGFNALLRPLRPEYALERLRHISLSRTGVDDQVMNYFAALPQLETLAIDHTRVTGQGLRKLASSGEYGYLRNLKWLRVSDDQLTDEVREALEKEYPGLDIRIQAGN